MININKIEYFGWKNCYHLSNNILEMIVVTDIGPRIINFRLINGKNQFLEIKESLGKVGGKEWRLYGGHRLWHAPEAAPRTYYPDNKLVNSQVENENLVLVQETEETTGIKKEIVISLHPTKARADIIHRLHNQSLWPIEFAPWALTIMAPGGRAIVPLPPKGSHPECLLPNGSIILWPFTDMSDERWYWGNKFVFLDQKKELSSPQKVGFHVVDGWAAYQNGTNTFIKLFNHNPFAIYPDKNSNVELFVNNDLLEVETLGPLSKIDPGESVEHKETWLIFDQIEPISSETEASILESKISKEKSN